MSPRTRLAVLDFYDPGFAFLPGQAVEIVAPGEDRRRTYSIACSPERAAALRGIELLVGVGSDADRFPLKRGTVLDVIGPVGTFTAPPRFVQRRVLFVAGGTGIAPLRSMLHHMCGRNPSTELALLYSARTADELAFLDEWRALAAAGRLHLHSTITRSDRAWQGPRGRLSRAVYEDFVKDRAGDVLCFVCGPAPFVIDARAVLLDLRVPGPAIRAEEWLATAAPPVCFIQAAATECLG
jgi:NAD(P)H-flavin reductase